MVSVLLYITFRREGIRTSLDTCVELKSSFQSAMCSLHVDHAYGLHVDRKGSVVGIHMRDGIHMRELKPSLNTQSDSIRSKLFV